MRSIVKAATRIEEIGEVPEGTYRGHLAEDYDGIGQYIAVSLSQGSVSSAYKARIAAGDFNTGTFTPKGTPVVLTSTHGVIEVLMGNKSLLCAHSTEPPLSLSFLIDPGNAGYSEIQYGTTDNLGNLYVQVDGGNSPPYDPSHVSLACFDFGGELQWAVASDFLANPIHWFDGSIFMARNAGSGVLQVQAFSDEDGSTLWKRTDLHTGGGLVSAVALEVQESGNLWVTFREGTTNWYCYIINGQTGDLISSVLLDGSGFFQTWLQANADRTAVWCFQRGDQPILKLDTDGNQISSWLQPAPHGNAHAAGGTPDNGFAIWIDGLETAHTVWSINPEVVRYDEFGNELWRTNSLPYLWNDAAWNELVVICNKIYCYGIDYANYSLSTAYMYTGLLVLDYETGEFISYQQLNDDPATGPLFQFLDTYLHAAGHGWMWVGGANYSDSYDGLPMDPAIGDYGFVSLLKLRS